MTAGRRVFQVADWLVEPELNRLSRAGRDLRLEPRTMEVLVALAERRGALVGKRELIDRVWQVEAVAESSLTRTIADLRRALGDDARRPRYIETVTRRGYRLVADVTAADCDVLAVGQLPAEERPLCVAREAELTRLEAMLSEALAGRGRVALVSGEAGTGKTVLLRELGWRASERHDRLVAAAVSCSAHTGVGDPFAAIRRLLGLLTGDLEPALNGGGLSREQGRRLGELAPVAMERITTSGPDLVDTLLPGLDLLERARVVAPRGSWLDDLERLVEHKASLPSDATLQQRAVIGQCVKVLVAVARRRPLLVVVDDLHWADSGSVGLIFELVREIAHCPILVVGSFRPEDLALEREGGRHPLVGVIGELRRTAGEVIVELSTRGDRGFVEALVDSEPNRLGRAFRDRLFRCSEGHALFTVEMLRTLQARGMIVRDENGCWVEGTDLDWGVTPARVEGVVGGRVDRLERDQRELLELAAVEGAGFTAEVLARVRGESVGAVVRDLSGTLDRRHRLVSARGVTTVAGGRLSRYAFAHALFQSYLYDRLDPVELAHHHDRIGTALEELYGAECDQVAVELARHFECAGRRDKAIRSLEMAARRAMRMTANLEASTHYRRALDLLASEPPSETRDRRELGLQMAIQGPLLAAFGWGNSEAGRAVDRALELVERVGDESQLVPVLFQLVNFEAIARNVAKGIEMGERALDLAENHEISAELVLVHWLMGIYRAVRGDLVRARAHLEASAGSYEAREHRALGPLVGLDPAVASLGHLAWVLSHMGCLDQALLRAAEALRLGEEVGHPHSLCLVHLTSMWPRYDRGEHDLARAHLGLAREILGAHGFEYSMGGCLASFTAALEVADGDPILAVAEASRAVELQKATGMKLFLTKHLSILAGALRAAGDAERAHAALDEGEALANEYGEFYALPELRRLRADLLLDVGEAAAAEGLLVDSLALARSQAAGLHELHAATALARLWRGRGAGDRARALLGPVVAGFEEGLETAPVVEARALLVELEAGARP